VKQPIPFGKYYLLERINVGGMAEVFKAKAFGVEGFERLLAIKRILPNIAEDEEFITMFIDEAKIAVQLTHANVAQIFDLGKVDDSYFIALEYVHGKDLRAIFDRARRLAEPLPIPMACFIIMKVCEGLDYAHNKRDGYGREMNLVHRDISPQNVLVSYEGEVKLIDFGIATAANKASKTQAGILKGKFGYMSPEQVRGLPLDRRSDIFSLGIVLYELLTGERLFLGESDFSTLEKVRNVEIMPPATYNHRISDELEAIILRALEREADERYQTAIDLHDDLQRFMYATGQFFSRKDLAAYMKSAFADELIQENEKLEQFKRMALPAPGAAAAASSGAAGAPRRSGPLTSIPAPPMPASGGGAGVGLSAGARLGGSAAAGAGAGLSSYEVDDVDIEDAESGSGVTQLDSDAIELDPSRPRIDVGRGGMGGYGRDIGSPPRAVGGAVPFDEKRTMAYGPGGPAGGGGGNDSGGPNPLTGGASGGYAPYRPSFPPPPGPGYPTSPAVPQALPSVQPTPSLQMPVAHPLTPLGGVPQSAEVPLFEPQYVMPHAGGGAGKVIALIAAILLVLLAAAGGGAYFFVWQSGELGTLTIESEPKDVDVLIGGERVKYPAGNVPTFELAEGTYEVTLLADGYAPFKRVVKIRAGKGATLDAELESVKGGVAVLTGAKVSSVPAGAKILIDGKPFEDHTPTVIPSLAPGPHEVTFDLPGYKPLTKSVTIKEGELLPLTAELEPLLVSVTVQATPDGVLTVSGGELKAKDFGKTPAKVDGLKAGVEYTFEVVAPGHTKWSATRTFSGEKAEEAPIMATLEKGGAPPSGAHPPAHPPGVRPPVGPRPPAGTAAPKPPAGDGVAVAPKGTGTLKVSTKPWTTVFVDGKEIGNVPILNYEISAGKHKVTLVCGDEKVCADIAERKKTVSIVIDAGATVLVKETLN
jgi:hypothetical protein